MAAMTGRTLRRIVTRARFGPAVAALLTVLPLVGCTDMLAERQAFLSGLIGQSEADAVRSMGVPTRSFDVGGQRFLAYDERRLELLPAAPVMPPWGWRAPWGYESPFPNEVVSRRCETVLEIADGRVRSFQLHGNACG
jgi:hypothetical protein